MTLWIVLALMTLIAAAGVSLPLIRRAPRRAAGALILAGVFALALGGLYPLVGRPDLSVAPPKPVAAAADRPDPQLVRLVPLLEARMKATPGDPRGWRLLGLAYSRLQRFGDAANAYGRAAGLAPGEAADLSAQGEALTQAADGMVTPGARGLFGKALALDPGDARARYFMAMAKDEDGDHAGAMADWIAQIRSAPPDAPWLGDLRVFVQKVAAERGVDLTRQLSITAPADGQQAMIQAMVERLAAHLKAQPRDLDGWIRLVRSRVVLGDPPAAAAALRDGLAAFGDSPAMQGQLRAAAADMGVSGG